MAGRWSTEQTVAQYKDLQANAMAVDCTGQFALLAGRRALAIVNLNKTADVKKIPRQSKWEMSAAQWNPHASMANVFVTACNQRADIWSWDDGKGSSSPRGSLKAHTRVISDLDWNPCEPPLLATCSGDSFALIWDTRDTRKPAISLQAVAGASQVKWNKLNSNLLATTHDGDIRLWDPRRGTAPVQYMAAHLAKIHGLDWSPHSDVHMATSSQDSTVKFWDVTKPKQSEGKLSSTSPVWKARYTPFGKSLTTVMVPQLRRGEYNLFLWHLNDLRQPIHTFMGHQDVVLEFQWRRQGEDYELVTWSKDQSLRLWKIDPQLLKLCGEEVNEQAGEGDDAGLVMTAARSTDSDSIRQSASQPESLPHGPPDATLSPQPGRDVSAEVSQPVNIPPAKSGDDVTGKLDGSSGGKDNGNGSPVKSASLVSRREEMHSPQQPKTLQQEFTLVNFEMSNVTVEDMDADKRTCTVSAGTGKSLVKVTMTFPESYPNNAAPTFMLVKGTVIDKNMQNKVIKVLRDTALTHVKFNRSCIEPCLRQLVSSLDSLSVEDRRSPETESPYTMQPPGYFIYSSIHPSIIGMQDTHVPYPRTCGARFCGAGFLVCFSQYSPTVQMRRTSSNVELTPRALSSLSAFSQGSRTPQGAPVLRNLFASTRSPPTTESTLAGYYSFKERKQRSRSKSRARDCVISENRNNENKKSDAGAVIIYNIAGLLPINKQLAESYQLKDKDVPSMCRANATAAGHVGRKDLVQVWSLAALATSECLQPDPDPDKGPPWAVHPFGRQMVKSLLDHYCRLHDVQTLAMLCCAFGGKSDLEKVPPSPSVSRSTSTENAVPLNYNAYHTIHPSDTSLKGWNYTIPKIRRSNSWSTLYEDNRHVAEVKDASIVERDQHCRNTRLLEQNALSQYDQFKRAYAEQLYRWGLLNQRADVLKYVSTPAEPHKGVDFNANCQHCQQEGRGAQCGHCKRYTLQCTLCHLTVRGASSFCLACGHGGHLSHMTEWFQGHGVCPSGCGCRCLEDNPMCVTGDD